MTGGADLDHQVFAERRARREFIAATTGDLDVRIVGMDVGFHGCSLGRCLKKGRVGYSLVPVVARPRDKALSGPGAYPQKLWINLWKEIERVT